VYQVGPIGARPRVYGWPPPCSGHPLPSHTPP
jgi:hypothetical protein